jgi:hypothetical protein
MFGTMDDMPKIYYKVTLRGPILSFFFSWQVFWMFYFSFFPVSQARHQYKDRQ